MKKVGSKALVWYGVAALASLFLIFFVGSQTEKGTGNIKTILTSAGITHFKKGLDLAGGVRLTYKIDFSKYEQVYAQNPGELMAIKKMAQDIILKNIDKRISTLGVSDYNSYVQKLSDGEYIIVEIGGLQDLEAAKKLIGKTVELEFKVPNESKEEDATVVAQRQTMAEDIFAQVAKNPGSMKDIGSTKGSQDVYYNNFEGVTIDELPAIYKKNITAFEKIATGTLYPQLLTGVYHVSVSASASGDMTTDILEGFTSVRFNGKKTEKNETPSLQQVSSYATNKNISLTQGVSRTAPAKTQSLSYDSAAKKVVYMGNEMMPSTSGYDIVLYAVGSGEDAQAILQRVQKGDVSGLKALTSGWYAASDLASFVPSFVYAKDTPIKIVKELEGSYVIQVRDMKDASDKVFAMLTFPAATQQVADEMIAGMTQKTLYSFEDILVSKSLRWKPAVNPKDGSILNGAYFKFANVSQGQTGKPVVSIQFDDKGKEIFCNLTETHVGKQMAIFVGGNLMTAPVIRDKICGGSAQIDGSFDTVSARKLADDLNSGALPAGLLLSHEETIAPSLGQNALRAALWSGAIGMAIIYFVMLLMYGWKKANIALIGLLAFLIYLLGIVKALGIVSSLSGIAAIILSLGMAVDANILMYERIREEQAGGKNMMNAIEDGYDRSWAPIKDGNMTSGIIGLLLFLVGVNVFKGFGTMMVINMLLILFVIVPLTKYLLRRFYRHHR